MLIQFIFYHRLNQKFKRLSSQLNKFHKKLLFMKHRTNFYQIEYNFLFSSKEISNK